jgi:hypothetical protein
VKVGIAVLPPAQTLVDGSDWMVCAIIARAVLAEVVADQAELKTIPLPCLTGAVNTDPKVLTMVVVTQSRTLAFFLLNHAVDWDVAQFSSTRTRLICHVKYRHWMSYPDCR